ncbi:hypothetical protein PGTUg99_005773 [Puccinia graminis f. sp. tritici]|uniref:CCR4-Not complex component Not1 C-terminal domain-containing protein n=1 Tax=Puccinia graminis f. sp. tritici TaxID=56615 RepID=A0A5B0RZ31_PUCGR|nr:hypothetical protein PGTUg99_005773 [Puccinia graminis f. sp. tritici]
MGSDVLELVLNREAIYRVHQLALSTWDPEGQRSLVPVLPGVYSSIPSNLIESMQPSNFPGFTTSWMALISHRLLIPKLLMFKDREGWSTVHRLLLGHLRFLRPFLASGTLDDVGWTLYTGTVRIFLVLLHDFPTFLSVYHHTLCSALPPHCIQLSNLILAAFPLGVRLHDPFVPGFNLKSLPDSRISPTIISDFTHVLAQAELHQLVDKATSAASPQIAVVPITDRLTHPTKSTEGTVYDIPLLNSLGLYLYLGVQDILRVERESVPLYDSSCTSATIYKQLVNEIDPEGGEGTSGGGVFGTLGRPTTHPFGVIYAFIKFLSQCGTTTAANTNTNLNHGNHRIGNGNGNTLAMEKAGDADGLGSSLESLKAVKKSQELMALFVICRKHVVQIN